MYLDASQAIYVPIKQNNIKLFGGKNIQKNNAQVNMGSAQMCNKVITNLFIAPQQRNTEIDYLFMHEISYPPPSLYSAGEVNVNSSKLKLMNCMIPDNIIFPATVNCPAILIDG